MYAFVEDEEHRHCDPHNPWRERDIADTVSLFCVKGISPTTSAVLLPRITALV